MPLTLLAAFGWSTTTDAQVKLAHKFPDGRTSTSISDVETEQTLTIAGMEILTKSKQKVTVTAVNGVRAADGTLVVQQRIDALKSDIDIMGQKLSFDSAKPDAPPPGTSIDIILDLFKAVSNSEWTVRHGRDHRVIAVDGRDKALKSLPDALRKGTEKQFDPTYLAQIANDELATIPDQPVNKGDTWKLETTVRLDGGQTMTFSKTFTYQGAVQQNGRTLHRISEQTTDVVYDMEANPESPLTYVDSDLMVADSKGENAVRQ